MYGVGPLNPDRAPLADTFGKTVIKIISETIKYEGRINRIRFYGKNKGLVYSETKAKTKTTSLRFQMGSQRIKYNAHIKRQPRNSFSTFDFTFALCERTSRVRGGGGWCCEGEVLSITVSDIITPAPSWTAPLPPPSQQAGGTHPTGMLSCLFCTRKCSLFHTRTFLQEWKPVMHHILMLEWWWCCLSTTGQDQTHRDSTTTGTIFSSRCWDLGNRSVTGQIG